MFAHSGPQVLSIIISYTTLDPVVPSAQPSADNSENPSATTLRLPVGLAYWFPKQARPKLGKRQLAKRNRARISFPTAVGGTGNILEWERMEGGIHTSVEDHSPSLGLDQALSRERRAPRYLLYSSRLSFLFCFFSLSSPFQMLSGSTNSLGCLCFSCSLSPSATSFSRVAVIACVFIDRFVSGFLDVCFLSNTPLMCNFVRASLAVSVAPGEECGTRD